MKALIVVDVQNDFVSGSLGTREAQAIIPNLKNKIKEYNDNDNIIIFTRDTHYDNYLETSEGKKLPVKHCIYGTEGWNIASGLVVDGCSYVNKHTFGYMEWGSNGILAKCDEIELVGLCTDICVVSNAIILKATFPDIEVSVDASCCAGVTPEAHQSALEVMKSCQVNVIGE